VSATAAQFDLFSSHDPAARAVGGAQLKPLRPYQVEAAAKVSAGWAVNRSQLVVMPTGTGKTRLFSEVARTWRGPVLVIAHRDELITQGRRALEENCGELVSTEKAELRADGTRIVVASVQTLKGDRLAAFARRHPATLVICDEAHHAVSPSYRAIFDAFGTAKVLGVTATPDRADEAALGNVFDDVAFQYEIRDAIRDGFLCPIRIKQVLVGEIDLSGVGTVAGDLNQGELDAVMQAEQVIHGVVKPMVELVGARRTIVFCTSVDSAHRTAEVINRYRPDQARAVDGTTAPDARRRILRDHADGRYQYLCNVGVLTEGYDDPAVSCVAMARPTKSRALYAQCAGRGLRIAAGKEDCLLLDFVGNSGKHRLISGLDILDGIYDDDVVDVARDIVAREGADGILAEDALERAQRERDERMAREAARRNRLTARRVDHVVIDRDPFAILDLDDPAADPRRARYRAEATPGQISFLEKKGIQEPEKLSKAQASAIIGKLIANSDAGLATYKQVRQMKKYGINTKDVTFAQARRVMDAIAANHWRPLAPGALAEAMERQAGEEG
jgi:superfamily II DNA or RNA helicase